ncbi:MAG: S8 family serine peptidase [Bacteroidaceae bacterium]|nr:S8 family serine peptidase [Bacteroidaceae bacterium]
MKAHHLLISMIALWTLFPGSSVAQDRNNEEEVVKLHRHNHRSYREGEVIVKFKQRVDVNTRTRRTNAQGVNRLLGSMGVTEMEALMPMTGRHVSATRVRAYNGQIVPQHDMSRLYRLRFGVSDSLDVHRVVENLKALSEVELAEPNYVVYTLAQGDEYTGEPLYSMQWGLPAIGMPQLWQKPIVSSKRPVIAILDTGVDITHPDLVDNIWTNAHESEGEEEVDDDGNGYADDLHGYDFVNQTGRLGDWNGHGTHCAGIAAAVGNNGIGITGANPDALIMPITVMQSDGTGDVATIIKGIDYAVANGADVISMSFGGYAHSIAEEQALAKAYTHAVLVAAAGNDCRNINHGRCSVCQQVGSPMFPAAFTFVLGVEATDNAGARASFSNFDDDGPVLSKFGEEQLYNYELRAPGVGIMSTYPGGKYKQLNGTSMACPMVAGGISRLLQTKEYANKEMLFGDLIMTHKQVVDFPAVYALTDADRRPSLSLVTYLLNDSTGGDGDLYPDAGETIALYPTLRNAWGTAENIRFTLEVAENEDPTIVEILDSEVAFGKTLSAYGKNISATPLRFKLRDDCTDGRHIRLLLKATCDNTDEVLQEEITLTAENGVEIGGMITENTTLYPGVNYIVTKNLVVANGSTLTILPGTIIKLKNGSEFTMLYTANPKIICKGTPELPIIFTQADNKASRLFFHDGEVEYTYFLNMNLDKSGSNTSITFRDIIIKNCVFKNLDATRDIDIHTYNPNINNLSYKYDTICKSNFFDIEVDDISTRLKQINIVGVIGDEYTIGRLINCNSFANKFNQKETFCESIAGVSDDSGIFKPEYPSYHGSGREDVVHYGIYDLNHPISPKGSYIYDLSNMLTRPNAEAHGIVWKVVVNGYDAQDEFEILPPLGVGKHKFEVYFNRPMDVSVPPTIAMGVRPPYTQHAIAEEGSWSADSLVYTAYLTIDGKTGADGLNRIYVSGARDNEYFEIPDEKYRFNVQVAATGSMATGLMAEAGLGKVSLTWETDEEDFEDLLGYNIYRYTLDTLGVSSDSIIVNPTVLEADATEYVDYDVVPGTTYYYVIKQLTTSLSSHALSNAVAATPLTAQKGDANGSMSVDVADVVSEVAYMTNQNPQPFIFEAADVNSDLQVNILDVVGTLNLILTPADAMAAAVNSTATYTVENGILYVESPVALGGVQVKLKADKGSEFTALEALDGFEQAGTWQSDDEYLFLAYSMVGRTIATGRQPLLRIGDARISEVVLSDRTGNNVMAIDGNATGLGAVNGMQMKLPYPNPFGNTLHIPYIIGQEGQHRVSITVCDMAGRLIHKHSAVNGFGEYTHTWNTGGRLANGLYLVSLYVDGKLMHTAKAIHM